MTSISSKSVSGLMEFCTYLADKGLATRRTMENWRGATRTVFSAVEGEDFGKTDLSELDLDEFLQRFETLTRGKYKPDSLSAYGSRVRNAVEAYLDYVETGQTPKLRKPSGATSGKRAAEPSTGDAASGTPLTGNGNGNGHSAGDLMSFPFPLESGETATLKLPRRLRKTDADRLSAFLRTLQSEPQREIPQRTGEDAEAA